MQYKQQTRLTLQAITTLGLLAHDVQNGVNELGALGVVALGPVVARTGLAKHKVVWAEDLREKAKGTHKMNSHFAVQPETQEAHGTMAEGVNLMKTRMTAMQPTCP
jgi:hypothetical protein